MTKKETLIKEIEKIPEPLLDELLDFINFLKAKMAREKYETMIVSEPVLKRDWLRSEEDAAWKDLQRATGVCLT
ncbi:MAG: DUF2281 domain-containing protein [Methanophagales archaeon]|nr:DUF2281 domain-containing protein [Methanophagales archaeon]